MIPQPSITTSRPARVLLVGNVAYADAVAAAIPWADRHAGGRNLWDDVRQYQPDLIVVAGWRRLLPPWVISAVRCVGFHSAKLPDYPGRAPVPWTFLRGDREAYNTLLYLDEGIDSGDIIDQQVYRLSADDTPETVYDWIGESSVELLEKHLTGLLNGTAPRAPQDPSRRGPLTTKDGWERYALEFNTRR